MTERADQAEIREHADEEFDTFSMGAFVVSGVAMLGVYAADAVEKGAPVEKPLLVVSGAAFIAGLANFFVRNGLR